MLDSRSMGSSDDSENTMAFTLDELLKQAGQDERRVTATLVCLSGRAMGLVFRMSAGENVVGRVDTAQVILEDEGVSRRHACISAQDGTYTLTDLGSKNGTICNGDKVVEPRPLHDGDKIRLGPNTVLRFEYQDEHEEQMRSRLYDLATRDALTKAYNRRYFLERLGSEWAWSVRHQKPCSLLSLDVDHFKRVNDTYGHPMGDYVLKELVVVVNQVIRKEDLFARYGGEEFILLARATGREDGVVIAGRILTALRKHDFSHDGHLLKVTVSIGVATSLDQNISTADQLIARADEYLYRAKEGGRDRAEFER